MRAFIVAIALAGSLAACADQRQELAAHVANQGYQNVRFTGWEYCQVGIPGQGFVGQRGGAVTEATACLPMGHDPYIYFDDQG
ncbi:MAG: hypothetical protein AB7G39_14875 [Alphaproteobacteria bacterium]